MYISYYVLSAIYSCLGAGFKIDFERITEKKLIRKDLCNKKHQLVAGLFPIDVSKL